MNPDARATRRAYAYTFGGACAVRLSEVQDFGATDADGGALVNVANPLPGDFEALEGKLLDPTPEERAAFVEGYRDQLATMLAGRDGGTP